MARMIACAVAAFLLVPGCALWRSESRLRTDLLERVPLGSDISKVRDLIREESWEVTYDDEYRGVFDLRLRPFERVGDALIHARLGSHPSFLGRAFVSAVWAFDADKKLIAVWVRKGFPGM